MLVWHWRVLKWGKEETGKNSKFGKTYTEKGFSNVTHNFSFLKHTWPSKMKFLFCFKKVLGQLYLEIFEPY